MTETERYTEPVTVLLTPTQKAELTQLARSAGSTASTLVRGLVINHLAEAAPDVRLARV